MAPEERAEEMVNATSVFPFTDDMKALISDINKMQRLVEDPTKSLSKDLSEKHGPYPDMLVALLVWADQYRLFVQTSRIKKRTLSYLAQQGVDIEIIEKAQKLDVTIADLPQIQKTKAILLGLSKSSEAFLNETEEFARAEIRSFTSQLGLRDIFLPTRDKGMSQQCLIVKFF